MIRLPERLQVADALSGGEALSGSVRRRTDRSTAVGTNERSDGRGESSNRSPAAAHDLTPLFAYDVTLEGEHRSVDGVRRAGESFVDILASRFEAGDRGQSGIACARWKRARRPDIVGGVIRSAGGFDAGWPTVRATTDSMADESPALRVAHGTSVAVELQTPGRGVDGFDH